MIYRTEGPPRCEFCQGSDMHSAGCWGVAMAAREQRAWTQAVHEWLASGEAFTATAVLARRDEILASR